MRPPLVADCLLSALCPPSVRDDVRGDLHEEYLQFKVLERGRLRARLWYWRQVLRSGLEYKSRRRGPGGRQGGRGGRHGRKGQRVGSALSAVSLDFRYALRALRKSPGFTAAAVITLALGIGATAAVFSVVDTFLFTPLPYDEAERLVDVYGIAEERGWTYFSQALPDFLDIREQSRTMSVAAWRPASFNLTGGDSPERIMASRVSWNFFDVLRVDPVLGRSFVPDEERMGRNRVVVLSDGLWNRRFGADRSVVGAIVSLDGEPFTVVGVLPPNRPWLGTVAAEIWTPFGISGQEGRSSHNIDVIGRLAPGATLQQAHDEAGLIAGRLAEAYPTTNTGWGAGVRTLHEDLLGEDGRASLILLAAVATLLLIACANVANLMLARAAGRSREIAVRGALGAGRVRIARQLLTEAMLLSMIGGGVGLLVAVAGIRGLLSFGSLPVVGELALSGRVLLFSLAVTTATGVLFGLAPVFHAWRPGIAEPLKQGAPGTSSVRGARLRRTLVVSEIALALALLVVCALLAKNFVQLRGADFGWEGENLLTFRVALPPIDYPDGDAILGFHNELLARLEAHPGVASAGGINFLPLREVDMTTYTVAGEDSPSRAQQPAVSHRLVFPSYFRTMGVSLVAGRLLDTGDRPGGPAAVVINEAMRERHWANENPLGERITFWDTTREIVGVVSNTRDRGASQELPMVFWSALQRPTRSMAFVVRTTSEPASVAGAVRAAVLQIDPNLPVYEVMSMEEIWWVAYSGDGIVAAIMMVCAGVATALAVVGIYGVMTYSVASRSHELGVRIALGARRFDVLTMVLYQGAKLALVGIGLGLLIASAITQGLAAALFGVAPYEPVMFIGIAGALLLAALVAVYVPARRATRVDPMVALRAE